MGTIIIEIINPKVKQLLKTLADLNLITIKPKTTVNELLENLRKHSDEVLSLDEIADEVDIVRKARSQR